MKFCPDAFEIRVAKLNFSRSAITSFFLQARKMSGRCKILVFPKFVI